MQSENESKITQFFLNTFTMENIFREIKMRDYLFLYHIEKCVAANEQGKVYLFQLTESMDLKMPAVSKGVKRLHEKGYVEWATDTECGRTYVTLTKQAIELMAEEHARMKKAYEKILSRIGEEELERTSRTMIEIKDILEQV